LETDVVSILTVAVEQFVEDSLAGCLSLFPSSGITEWQKDTCPKLCHKGGRKQAREQDESSVERYGVILGSNDNTKTQAKLPNSPGVMKVETLAQQNRCNGNGLALHREGT